MTVPFADLYAQYLSIKEDIDAAISDTIKNSAYIGGSAVKNFEASFAKWLGIQNVIACGNGTDSIEIILKALGIGPGHEVIVPANSWISTSEAVGNMGATPVFVDVNEDDYTINVALAAAAVTSKTKAIIPVHLYGHPADMYAVMELANKHGLAVIEDCAQSHGASIGGKLTGTFGTAASFSFYPGKNLGAYGDAGCMATNDAALAEKLRMIANHGQLVKHNHVMEGRNSRLDGLQAAILNAKLPYLTNWTEKRIEAAAKFSSAITNTGLHRPVTKQGCRHVFHLYVVRTKRRNELQQLLKHNGVETAIHYPTALPLLPAYQSSGHSAKDFPVAAAYQEQILSLPIYPELSDEAINYIAGLLNEF
jgi:dTDP-4-amino-4,6-dideoxygalactose transaminase